jgi:hypothetical protein
MLGLDPFHVTKLGLDAVDQVRRRARIPSQVRDVEPLSPGRCHGLVALQL